MRIYACNISMQPGETEGFDLADHVEALVAHTQPGLVDLVLANDRFNDDEPAADEAWPAAAVRLRWPPSLEPVPLLVTEGVANHDAPHRHDPERLAAAILRAYEREGQSMRRERVERSA
jgi:2-phospho-L-lactate transferase/gluconeogenesis factor (CofD/UPF0052 family)